MALKWVTLAKVTLGPKKVSTPSRWNRTAALSKRMVYLIATSKLMSMCNGLVILHAKNGHIRLLHYTIKKSLQKHLNDNGNLEIAMMCLQYL